MKKLLFLLPLGAACLSANQIQSVKFDGLIHLSSEVARQISGLSIGEEMTPQVSNKAITSLFAQNYFEDIYITDDGYGNITVYVKEKPSIAHVELKGVVTNDKTAIESLIGIKAGNMYDELSIERTIEKIRQFYEVKGYFDTVVEVTKEPVAGNPSSLSLTLDINRGENIIIKKINLIGAKKFDYSDFEPIVANKTQEFMGWMWGRNDGKLKLYELPSDSGRILDKYFQKGYLNASVSAPYLQTYFDSYTANLTYYIQEGEQYRVFKIAIKAPEFLQLNTQAIIDDFRLGSGDVVNSEKIRADVKTLEDMIANKGYAFVSIYPRTIKDDSDRTATIIYEVNPGDQVKIRNVIISGNDRTADRVIRREMYLTEGELYNRTDLEDSKDALSRTGYFEDVQIKEQRVGQNEIDLLVEVKETSTGAISGGVGYGSSDGLLLNASVSDSNIMGSGLKGAFSVDRSDNELSGQISLTNPRLFDSPYSLGGSIYARRSKWDSYHELSKGFSVTTGRQLTRNLSASLTYTLEKSDISGLSAALKAVGYKEGVNLKSSITPAISYNSTDDYYLPRKGILAGSSLEFAGVGGDEKFLKSRSYFNYYFGLKDYVDYDFILRYKANFAKIWNRGYVPINEKLYLGGISSVRGFENRTVSPKLPYGGEWYETGGEIAFNNSLELSFPLINRVKMRGVLFYDYGMIGETSLNEIKRSSTGLGVEWITPIGPLQLIFAKPLKVGSNDDTSRFEFSIGRRF